MVGFKQNFNKYSLLGIIIGIILGGIFGIIIGSPVFGIILGAFVGFKIPSDFKRFGKGTINIKKNSKHFWTTLIVILILLAILLYFFRPWFHEFFMIFYTVPMFSFLIIFAIGLGLSAFFKNKNFLIVFSVLLIITFVVLMFNNVIMQKYIVSSTEYNKIDSLPDSNELRLLPKAVANRYLEDSLQKSRETVGPLDIIKLNDSLIWTSPRIPDGGILYLTQSVNGILTADASATSRKTKIITSEMVVGEGIGITDNIFWKLYKEKFFVSVDDVYYMENEGKIFAVAPVIGYEFKFPVMVPVFKGVFIVDGEGDIDFVDADDVDKNDLLKKNKIYPESLARLYVDSYKYNKGWINAVFLHEDQIEISDVYGQYNRQPFLMDTKDGLKWVVATEPYGNSYGVFKIFLVDAFTGKIDLLELNEDQTLTGPVRVVSYVKKKFPTIDWATSNVVEPRPYIIDGKLFWMLSITPSDFAGVSYTVLVNSEDNTVLAFDEDKQLIKYLKEGVYDKSNAESDDDSDEKIDIDLNETSREIVIKKIESIEDELSELKKLIE